MLINKQSREHAEKARITIKKTMTQQMDLANRVQKFVDCRAKDPARRELYIVEGDFRYGRRQAEPRLGVSRPSCPSAARF